MKLNKIAFTALGLLMNCHSIPRENKADTRLITEIRETINNRLKSEIVLSQEESRGYLDRIVPPETITAFSRDCPFVAPINPDPNDGVYIVHLNCGVADESGRYLAVGMLCYPGYYSPDYDDGRYEISPEPLKTLYDREYQFFLTSKSVCKGFRQGQKYKGKIYRHKSKSNFITILELNKL